MGIHVHKAIGYGLTDMAYKDYRITDPRINTGSFLLGGREVPPVEDYIAFVERTTSEGDFEARLEAGMLREYEGADVDSQELCIWKAEYGLPEVLLLRPFGCARWFRRDDPIDVEEEAIRGTTMEYRVERTVGNIHPYDGIYMDVRTGERFVGDQATRVRAWRRVINAPVGEKLTEEGRADLLDKIAKVIGYKDHAEAEQLIAPLVPDEVRRICEWGELFTSPDVWRQLRPILYTYWA
jgi:hypothetical protein